MNAKTCQSTKIISSCPCRQHNEHCCMQRCVEWEWGWLVASKCQSSLLSYIIPRSVLRTIERFVFQQSHLFPRFGHSMRYHHMPYWLALVGCDGNIDISFILPMQERTGTAKCELVPSMNYYYCIIVLDKYWFGYVSRANTGWPMTIPTNLE